MTRGGVTEFRHLIGAGTGTVAIYTRRSSGTPATDTYYIHRDHQGSPELVTNSAGAEVTRFSFSAYGARRDSTDWSGPISAGQASLIAGIGRRGYTDHEHLDAVGLVHMNGRVYEPAIGRFLSRDPVLRIDSSQGLNAYDYVWNNPLTQSDPTGLSPGGNKDPKLDNMPAFYVVVTAPREWWTPYSLREMQIALDAALRALDRMGSGAAALNSGNDGNGGGGQGQASQQENKDDEKKPCSLLDWRINLAKALGDKLGISFSVDVEFGYTSVGPNGVKLNVTSIGVGINSYGQFFGQATTSKDVRATGSIAYLGIGGTIGRSEVPRQSGHTIVSDYRSAGAYVVDGFTASRSDSGDSLEYSYPMLDKKGAYRYGIGAGIMVASGTVNQYTTASDPISYIKCGE